MRALSYLDHTMNGLTSFQYSMSTHSSASDSLLANMKNVRSVLGRGEEMAQMGACERGRLGRGKEGGGRGREGGREGGRERRRDGEGGREWGGREWGVRERGKEREGQRERGGEEKRKERETGAQWNNKILRRHCIPGLCFGE